MSHTMAAFSFGHPLTVTVEAPPLDAKQDSEAKKQGITSPLADVASAGFSLWPGLPEPSQAATRGEKKI